MKRTPAIVGVGMTDFASIYYDRDPYRSEYQLGIEALQIALDDAGLAKDDLDGVLLCRIPSYEAFGTMAGLRHPKVVDTFEGSGRMAGVVLQRAMALIEAGMAETIALVYGNNGRAAGATYGGTRGGPAVYNAGALYAQHDLTYGMTSPGAYVGMMYQRYMQTYGVPDGALAPLAISNRRNAQRNPAAVMKKDLSLEEYMGARYITDPLRLYDYCMINDGGVAIIVTTEDRAKNLRKTPVKVAATASSTDLTAHYTKTDFFKTASKVVADKLWNDSGLSPSDIGTVQIYDNFTPIMLLSLEHFGFAPEGEGWRFIQDGRIELEGELPINTSGGHTSEGYMQGWALEVEAIRQVRGDAGDRQVPGVNASQYICVSPIVTSHIFQRA